MIAELWNWPGAFFFSFFFLLDTLRKIDWNWMHCNSGWMLAKACTFNSVQLHISLTAWLFYYSKLKIKSLKSVKFGGINECVQCACNLISNSW